MSLLAVGRPVEDGSDTHEDPIGGSFNSKSVDPLCNEKGAQQKGQLKTFSNGGITLQSYEKGQLAEVGLRSAA